MGNQRHAGVDDLAKAGHVEVGRADVAYLPGAPQIGQRQSGVDVARHAVVPPRELHEVERLDTEPQQRPIDDAFHVAARQRGESAPIGHELGVKLNARTQHRVTFQELPDQLLDAGVDVGAVEARDAGLDVAPHVFDSRVDRDLAVAARELPAALDDARDAVAGSQLGSRERGRRHQGRFGSGTAVTSPWRKVRSPVRVMRNSAPQWGSGQAMSVSVVIQSLSSVPPLLGGEQRKQGRQRIERKRLAVGEAQVLARQLEVVAGRVVADHGALGCDHLDAQIVEGEAVVRVGHGGPPQMDAVAYACLSSPHHPGQAQATLRFRFGLVGALGPFALFLAGVAWLGLHGAPDEKGFWPVLLAAIALGLALAEDRGRYSEALIEGMSRPIVMLMVSAWLLAGVLGTLLSRSGFVEALIWAANSIGLEGGGYVAAAFLVCCLVSTSTGTSFGTILVAGPLLYPAGAAVGASPGFLLGAIIAGATFGDNVSPISDTTIASAGTQGADIRGVVRSRHEVRAARRGGFARGLRHAGRREDPVGRGGRSDGQRRGMANDRGTRAGDRAPAASQPPDRGLDRRNLVGGRPGARAGPLRVPRRLPHRRGGLWRERPDHRRARARRRNLGLYDSPGGLAGPAGGGGCDRSARDVRSAHDVQSPRCRGLDLRHDVCRSLADDAQRRRLAGRGAVGARARCALRHRAIPSCQPARRDGLHVPVSAPLLRADHPGRLRSARTVSQQACLDCHRSRRASTTSIPWPFSW